jgi:hypothetical protein
MPNPPKPTEQKRLLGNPGKRGLPNPKAVMAIPSGRPEPLAPLGPRGQELFDRACDLGEAWISPTTDKFVLQHAAELADITDLVRRSAEGTLDNQMLMRYNDLAKTLNSTLGLLGFTPADRTRLGLAEVKRMSKVEELRQKLS